MPAVQVLLDQIDSGTLLLPEFQRGYVWNRDQVRGLLSSLYRGYPVGSLLTWETEAASTATRGEPESKGVVNMLLDGQQRITTLYGVARGRPPAFFDGEPTTFSGLRFHVDEESFEFYAPVKMKDDPLWVDVTSVLSGDLGRYIKLFSDLDESALAGRLTRLNQLQNVLKHNLHLETITGADKTTDVVVDIFNRVNSGGTKLNKGDLALAKLTAQDPSIRTRMRATVDRWEAAGYPHRLEWLLRNATAVSTGRAQFRELDNVNVSEFGTALKRTEKYVGHLFDVIAGRLGLDHGRVVLGAGGFPVLARYLELNEGKFPTQTDQDKALYWLIHAGLWGRYSGSTETVMAQDLESLHRTGLDGLIQNIATTRGGSLRITAEDFRGNSLGARFYPLLYLLTRVGEARDLITGVPLKTQLLGHNSALEVHHLFPKAQLYAMDPPMLRGDVNAIANFALQTKASNLSILQRPPSEYFPEFEAKFPGVLASQWIPLDSNLWRLENYLDFLTARRELLANAANEFLDSLLNGVAPVQELPRLGHEVSRDEDRDLVDLRAIVNQLVDQGMAAPEWQVEVSHPETGVPILTVDAWWPDGLRIGQDSPAVVVSDLDSDVTALEGLGYRIFRTPSALAEYWKAAHV